LSGTYSGLATRLATAGAVIAILLAALLFLPAPWLAALVFVLVVFAGREWAGLCRFPAPAAWVYAGAMGAGSIAVYWNPPLQQGVFLIAAAFWLLVAPAWLWLGVSRASAAPLAAAGCVVLIPAAVAMAILPVGVVIGMLVFVGVADASAYFVGSRFGRHKLAPSISPGKSWEGAAGALGVILVYAIICAAFLRPLKDAIGAPAWVASWFAYLGAAAVLCAASVVGDLFESAAKRRAGVKDSGTLLPGHGGILDRIDSATAVLPLAALLWPLVGAK
jgi:phosphatidate cytidylyltransferase